MSLVTIIGSDGGCGKSMQSQRFPESIAYLDFEYPKGKKCIDLNNSDKLISLFPCREYHGYKLTSGIFQKADIQKGHKKGQINTLATYDLVLKTINDVLDISNEFETIVLDSISDIRSVVADKWLMDFRAKKPANADRKTVGKDPSAWSAINKILMDDILFPVINIGRIENKNIIFTARLEDEYKVIELESGKQDTAKTGNRKIDTQNWVTFEIDAIIELSTTSNGRYFMYASKTPKGIIQKTEITNKNIADVLNEKGIL